MQDRTVTLLDNNKIPVIGFGTYKTLNSDINIHEIAIEEGYRFFDTASIYETESSLGEAIKSSGIKRDELFIESKLWIDERGYKEARQALERSLDRLGLDYLDLYMIHWPKAPKEDDVTWRYKNQETIRALSEAKDEGLIGGIGLSNFLPHHINALDTNGLSVTPLVDQLELHIGYTQENALRYCKKHNIIPQAWSPLSRGDLINNSNTDIISKIANKYNKTPSQIALRFLIEKGIVPIVKASSREHMRANMNVFDFSLSEDDMSILESYPYNTWRGEHPDFAIPNKASSHLSDDNN